MISSTTVLICTLLFSSVLYNYFSGLFLTQLETQASLISQELIQEGNSYLESIRDKNLRITLIDIEGRVAFNNQATSLQMQNHSDRKEVQQALKEGRGTSRRYSDTLSERYLYYATKLPDGRILRLSVSQKSIFSLLFGTLRPIYLFLILILFFHLFLASSLSKKIVKPLNDVDLEHPLNNEDCYEIAPLLRRINHQQYRIRHQNIELEQRKREFETVTNAMSQGLVLLNGKGRVLSANRTALQLLEVDEIEGRDILAVYRSRAISDLLAAAQNRTFSKRTVELHGRIYELSARPILSEESLSGIVLLLVDITEKERSEQLRREFTANVSHELKTPLHTISGCAELLSNNMVKEHDIPCFVQRIYRESQRMIRLVEDIIRLSFLDENNGDITYEVLNLYPLVKEIVNRLSPEARTRNIRLELEGTTALVTGNYQLLESSVYNLCDNAIKYNVDGGSVTLSVKEDADFILLSIRDTGIGIPLEHQSRVFERFYRIDRSHSKKLGGTGLGLSIVKHSLKLHNATFSLQSALNKGTTITIRFPRSK